MGNNMEKHWKYKILPGRKVDLVELGIDGWELVAIKQDIWFGYDFGATFYFKKEIIN